MKNQSLADPLITAMPVHNGSSPTRRSFRLCCSLLGCLVGVLSQRNDLVTLLMVYFYHNVTNIFLLSMLYAAAATLQLMVFLGLLRATHTVPKDGDIDLECYFGTGAIVGVSMAWVTFLPDVLGACLLVIYMAASVMLYRVLLCVFRVDTVKEEESAFGFYMAKEEEAMKESEYRLMIV